MNDPTPTSSDASRPAAAAPPPRTRWWIAIAVLGIAAIGAAIWYASGRSVSAVPGAPGGAAGEKSGKAGKGGGDPASRVTPVVAMPVKQGTLDIYLFALGTVTPLNAVTVRSRVDGQLMRV